MTNKKLKMAAMSVALTACVAASPLAANADAPEAAPEELKKDGLIDGFFYSSVSSDYLSAMIDAL